MGLIHWYVAQDGIKDIVAWLTGATLTMIIGHPFWVRNRRRQDQIIDLLNTDTPGGLTDLLDALENTQPHHNSAAGRRGTHGT